MILGLIGDMSLEWLPTTNHELAYNIVLDLPNTTTKNNLKNKLVVARQTLH